METLAAGVPTLLIEERQWWRSFANDGVHLTSVENAAATLSNLYAAGQPQKTDVWKTREHETLLVWQNYIGA